MGWYQRRVHGEITYSGDLIITSATMKLLFLLVGFLATCCVYCSKAEEVSSSLQQDLNKISRNANIHFSRERRSPERRAKKKAGRGKRRNPKAKDDKRKKISNSKRSKEQKKNIRKEKKKARKSKKSKQKSIRNNGEKQKIKTKKNLLLKKKASKSETLIKPSKGNRQLSRKVLTGAHCQYVDLCMIDRMSESGCTTGQKFVIKSPKGTRRQFLMVDGSKIIAFLLSGKKITDCKGNLTDVTTQVSCKTVPGVADIKLLRQNETTTDAPDSETSPAPAPTPAPAPAPAPAAAPSPATEAAPVTDAMPPLQAGQVHCPCPTRTCFTTITSTNNNHKVQCGSSSFDVPCGGPLMGSKLGLIISIIDVFEQPLCSTNTYVTLINDLVWRCPNLEVPEDASCEEAEEMEPTTEAETETSDMPEGTSDMPDGPTDMPDGPTDMPTGASDMPTGASEMPTGAVATTVGSAETTSGASVDTTTSGDTTTTSVDA